MEKLPSNLVKLRGWGKPSSFGYQEDSSSATKSPGAVSARFGIRMKMTLFCQWY